MVGRVSCGVMDGTRRWWWCGGRSDGQTEREGGGEQTHTGGGGRQTDDGDRHTHRGGRTKRGTNAHRHGGEPLDLDVLLVHVLALEEDLKDARAVPGRGEGDLELPGQASEDGLQRACMHVFLGGVKGGG